MRTLAGSWLDRVRNGILLEDARGVCVWWGGERAAG